MYKIFIYGIHRKNTHVLYSVCKLFKVEYSSYHLSGKSLETQVSKTLKPKDNSTNPILKKYLNEAILYVHVSFQH